MIRDLLLLSASYFLVMLFAAAALHKLTDSAAFVRAVGDYRVIPAAVAGPAALLVILAELAAAAALLTPGFQVWGAGLAASLLMLYAAAMGINLARGRRRIDCGCAWGRSGAGLSWRLVLRNVGLAGLAVALVIAGPAGASSLVAHVNAALGAAALWAIYAALDMLGGNVLRPVVKESA